MNPGIHPQIDQLISAFKFLQLLLLEKEADKNEVESQLDKIQRQFAALEMIYDNERDQSAGVVRQLKRQIESLNDQLVKRTRVDAENQRRAQSAIDELRRERFHRTLIEEENSSLREELVAYNDSRPMLDTVDDTQSCPNCGADQMDRDVDDTCLCRYCMTRFALKLDDLL